MSDRELLEKAAKAAGYEFAWMIRGANNPNGVPNVPFANGCEWNPLEDDGDALRLAITLNLPIIPHTHGIGWVDVGHIKELCGSDPLAATRRAIVRAAANLAPPPNHKGE